MNLVLTLGTASLIVLAEHTQERDEYGWIVIVMIPKVHWLHYHVLCHCALDVVVK